jgi:hypothetical protein
MSAHNTLSKAFNDTCNALEAARQISVASATTQTSIISAELTYYRGCYKAALTNGISPSNFLQAMKSMAGVQS